MLVKDLCLHFQNWFAWLCNDCVILCQFKIIINSVHSENGQHIQVLCSYKCSQLYL